MLNYVSRSIIFKEIIRNQNNSEKEKNDAKLELK